MDENPLPKNTKKQQAIIAGLIGILLAIIGIYIIVVPGAPMRGSGIGTVSTIVGVIFLLVGVVRVSVKSK